MNQKIKPRINYPAPLSPRNVIIEQNSLIASKNSDTNKTRTLKASRLFVCREMVRHIAGSFYCIKDALNFLSVKKDFRNQIALTQFQCKPLVKMCGIDLFPNKNKEKFQFMQNCKLKFKIMVESGNDASMAIAFIKNNENKEYLVSLGGLNTRSMTSMNALNIINLFKFINPDNITLRSLSIGDINRQLTLSLPESFIDLTSFSCGNIFALASLMCPLECDELIGFSCENIDKNAIVTCPVSCKKLISLTIGNIDEQAMVMLPNDVQNLEYLSIGTIAASAQVTFPENLPNLKRLDFQKTDIKNQKALAILKDLESEIQLRAEASKN